MPRPRSRHLLAPALAAALLLTACGPQEQAGAPVSAPNDEATTASTSDDDAPPEEHPTADDDPTTDDPTSDDEADDTPAEDDSPAEGEDAPAEDAPAEDAPAEDTPRRDEPRAAADGDVPDLAQQCSLDIGLAGVDRATYAAPDGWRVDGSCAFLDPSVEQLEPGTEPDVAITVDVTDTPFHEAAAPGPETRDEIRYVGARSGYQAVRVRAEATGRGLYPQGTPVLHHLVDLDPGTDEAGGTLVLSARPSAAADFALAAEALDRMADTLRVAPIADDAGDAAVVSRVEGGGAPWTVTWTGDCLRLHGGGPDGTVVDEACELGAMDGGIRGVVLGDETVQVVAGFAPARASVVVSDAASAPYGAVTQPLEGSAAFAYTPIRTPVEVRALDVEGERLARATVR